MFYLVFIFGMIAGSFLNVLIHRLNPALQLKSGVFGRSMCPNCKTQLKWYDLIPLFSFIWLKRRCRHCGGKISWQYPTVEILSGLIWILVFSKNLDNFQFPISNFQLLNIFYEIFIFSALLVIAVYDFKWKIIPDKIIYPAIVVALISNLFKSLNFETFKLLNLEVSKYLNFEILKYINIETFIYPLLVASIAFLFFFAIYYFSSGRAMGLGDAKLAFFIGLFLSPLPAALAFALAFVIGAAFAIILIGLGKIRSDYRKWGMKSQIAFGPFLVLGAFIAFFFSDFIIKFLNF